MSKKDLKDALIFSLSANEDLAKSIADILGLKLSERKVSHFPSGETICEPIDSVRGKQVFIVNSTCPPVNENLMETLIFIDALKRASAKEINLICPYYGYARQDRKTKPRQPITAALVAHLLCDAGVDRVVTVNLHSTQTQGFFSCLVDDLNAVPLIASTIRKFIITNKVDLSKVTVVSPDHGGVKRARDLAAALGNIPIAIIDKRRNEEGSPEVMEIIGNVEGRDCVMIDDMIDTARSAVYGAEALKKAGASRIALCATHGVLSDPAYDLLKDSKFASILVTDSIPLNEKFKEMDKMFVVSLAPMLAECIERIALDEPVSAVYDSYSKPVKVE